ncbi:ABC transporter ATP-binding protein [Paenibacillus thiaminolyticus]|uniref:ABC transporter ATP-binding protein n=1 Tax=Paenibacillus thiaminolyticus TaxID=49283 RepID=UPI0035A67E33
MDAVIQMENVTKRFKNKTAVNGVSLDVRRGSVVAILGPNGAGKTTTISMLLGLMEPTDGTVRLFGKEPKHQQVRQRIGAMLQEVSIIDRLKVHEVIEMFRSYYPKPLAMERLIELTGLSKPELNMYAEKLSGGQKRRAGFALALAGDPELVFFDEPTVGMDVAARRRFWDQVRTLASEGKTVLFTTHYLQEADDAADRIILFHQGKIVEDGKPAEIKARLLKKSVSFQLEGDAAATCASIRQWPNVSDCEYIDGRIHIRTDDTDGVLATMFSRQLPARDIHIDHGRLDEAFEQLTMSTQEVAY